MKWGVFETEGRPVQVAPCTEDGMTPHFLEIECVCPWRWDDVLPMIIHEYDAGLDNE